MIEKDSAPVRPGETFYDDHHRRFDSQSFRSIAISLKRIADKLELSQKQPIYMDADEYQKYQDAQKVKPMESYAEPNPNNFGKF